MANQQNRWWPFEHEIHRQLKENGIQNKNCLLMVSGGADSMTLLEVFHRLGSSLNLSVSVLHCHHGMCEDENQNRFRDRARLFVEAEALKRNFSFHSVQSQSHLHSEEELRQFRKTQSKLFQQAQKFDFLVWGHHQDDFLETQMLRLIRGVGPTSLFEPMVFLRDSDLRPLLRTSRDEIIRYLKHQNIEWLEDPSNENEIYLRNWLRQNWLPQLEEKCPGALKSLSRSLSLLQEAFEPVFPSEIWVEKGISRTIYLTLSESQKKQVLALYLKRLGQNEFTHNQIQEVMRRLDNPQIHHTFEIARLVWTTTKDMISASSPFVVNAN